jgi:ornithine--oxo-acid transaminase
VSAFVATEEMMSVFQPGDHGSTFGGNPLACRVAREALAVLIEEKLPERAAALGSEARARLQARRHPAIADVRGRGLLIGVELRRELDAAAVVHELAQHGVITKDTHRNTVRLSPPLVVEPAELEFATDALFRVLDDAQRNIQAPRRAA